MTRVQAEPARLRGHKTPCKAGRRRRKAGRSRFEGCLAEGSPNKIGGGILPLSSLCY